MIGVGVRIGLGLVALLAAGSFSGCATGQTGASHEDQYLILRSEGGTWQVRVDPSGRVSGADVELATTAEGYRGIVSGRVVDMTSSDGKRVIGTHGGQPIDLHLSGSGGDISASGLFAGYMAHVQVGAGGLSSTVGRCRVALGRKDQRHYVGQRNCRGSLHIADAEVTLPRGFDQLPAHRQIMLLAAITSA